MDHHKRLYSDCAAYQAYIQLLVLPDAAPNFEFHNNGYPMVPLGEVFCRMPDDDQGRCGKKYSRREHLLRHIEAGHGAARRNRPTVRNDEVSIMGASQYYTNAMRDEEYEDKRTDAIIGPFHRSKKSKSAARLVASSATSDRPKRITAMPRLSDESSSPSGDGDGSVNNNAKAATAVSIDSDDDEPQQIKQESPENRVGISGQAQSSPESDDEDLRQQIEEDEVRLRLLENKRKLAARMKQRRARQ